MVRRQKVRERGRRKLLKHGPFRQSPAAEKGSLSHILYNDPTWVWWEIRMGSDPKKDGSEIILTHLYLKN